jgi:hypothetical protein
MKIKYLKTVVKTNVIVVVHLAKINGFVLRKLSLLLL